MDFYNNRNKRGSESGASYSAYGYTSPRQQHGSSNKFGGPSYSNYSTLNLNTSQDRSSYFTSNLPLYGAIWSTNYDIEHVALSTYKEDSNNKLLVAQGFGFNVDSEETQMMASDPYNEGPDGFQFNKVAEMAVDYPITNLQWDPAFTSGRSKIQRLATSSEVFRIYEVQEREAESSNHINSSDFLMNSSLGFERDPHDPSATSRIIQTHVLANNANTSASSKSNVNTFPPVTSFDWNKCDPSIIITSSVDTTCTIWDLSRSHPYANNYDSATIKTQLIAHDSEVFDVKFVHDSTNIFASVGNDGSIRVFDLRSLEHSTIIFEPPVSGASNTNITTSNTSLNSNYNSNALLRLTTSNIDQHHLAAIGVSSNQVIIIDMRMPGTPVARLDGSFEGANNGAINSISWHPQSNYLLTGGDDCQALVWDCNTMPSSNQANEGSVIDLPSVAYEADMEVNNACWRQNSSNWMGVVSGKSFQAVSL